MSGLLAGKVWQSNLEAHLKPLAAAMADIANDDGTNIYPSVAYLAWLLGKGERSVQYGLDELKTLGVIRPVAYDRGGRSRATEYLLSEEKLPKRAPWKETKKGATSAPFRRTRTASPSTQKGATDAPFTVQKGATYDSKRVQPTTERVQFETKRVQPIAPQPSLEPLVDPPCDTSIQKPPFSSPEFLAALSDLELHRKEIKKPLKPTGRKQMYRDFAEWGEEISITAIRKSISCGWQGVFKPAENKNGNGSGKSRVDHSMDAVNRVLASKEAQRDAARN